MGRAGPGGGSEPITAGHMAAVHENGLESGQGWWQGKQTHPANGKQQGEGLVHEMARTHVCIYTCVYTSICVSMRTRVSLFVCICIGMTCVYEHLHLHAHTCIFMHVCISVWSCVPVWYAHVPVCPQACVVCMHSVPIGIKIVIRCCILRRDLRTWGAVWVCPTCPMPWLPFLDQQCGTVGVGHRGDTTHDHT